MLSSEEEDNEIPFSVSVFRSRIIYIPDATAHKIIIGVVKLSGLAQRSRISYRQPRERVISLIKFIDTFLERRPS